MYYIGSAYVALGPSREMHLTSDIPLQQLTVCKRTVDRVTKLLQQADPSLVSTCLECAKMVFLQNGSIDCRMEAHPGHRA
jgi:hypothetical protein